MLMVGEDEQENQNRLRECERIRNRITGTDRTFRVMAVDLAQSNDYTAITINERTGIMNRIRHLERLTPGMSYPDQVSRIKMLLKISHIDRVVLDKTGVGAPVWDMLVKEGIRPIGILITGGNEATFKGSEWHVPKRDLISSALVSFQNKMIKIANVPERKALIQELQNFEIKISQSGHDTYAAAGTGHDDLVLSLSMSIFTADKLYRRHEVDILAAQGYGGLTEDRDTSMSYYEKRERALYELRQYRQSH